MGVVSDKMCKRKAGSINKLLVQRSHVVGTLYRWNMLSQQDSEANRLDHDF